MPALAPKHRTLLRMPIAPNMSIHRMPTMVRRASIQTAVPQPRLQLLNATDVVNDSLRSKY